MLNLLIASIVIFQLSVTALGVAFILIKQSEKEAKLEQKNKELQDALDKQKTTETNFYG